MSDRNFLNSYENQTQKISKSVFVTNFPEDSTARDLSKVCSDYGTIVDVFIPFKRFKSGKRFAFVRFIKIRVKELDAWFLNFQEDDQDDLFSDGESQKGDVANKAENNESDLDRVSESSFMHENDTAHKDKSKVGGSILDLMDELVTVGQTIGYNMAGLGNKPKRRWIKELCQKHRINFASIQETKAESISLHTIKDLWGNQMFDHVVGSSVGCLGCILCMWNPNMWEGDTVIMGDFNEVHSEHKRFGSTFNRQGAIAFNNFISLACLIDLPLEGYAFTWAHKSASKMSFNSFVETTWKSLNIVEPNGLIRLKKKLQAPKIAIKAWSKEANKRSNDMKINIQQNLSEVDKLIDQGKNQVQDLERTVTYEEVKWAVWDCGTNKSPGPDVFSFEFYRKYWTTIDDDVFQAVRDFFVNGHFPRGCNSSFIALILKIQDVKFVKYFRPISLIGSVYKIIAKILANRLCVVLPYLISDVQSAFVANRQILDGPFIVNELLSWCKFEKLNGMIFKVDFEKAFDSTKWDYLDETLKAFGFGSKWRNWISSCLNNTMGSVLVNGSPTLELQFHKGLKQVFIGEWNNNKIQTLLSVLRCFYLASGLKINLHKSKLMGIGVSSNVVAAAASLIGFSILTAPFIYLGVKVGSNMSRITSWDDVISKVGVLNHLESIRRNLFYGVDGSDRKLAWIGWNMVLTSKKNGGLGVSSFFAHNRALLFKWFWRFLIDGSSLWTRFIKAIFGNKGALDTHKLIPRISPWHNVILIIHSLQSKVINPMDFIQKKVGNGENTYFWDDSWLEEVALNVIYKRLYALEMYRWCWSLEGSQEFSVKSSRILIDNTILPKAKVPTRWLRVVPIKVNIHAWRVCLDKLPTRASLSLRGMDIPSIACPLCNSAVESSSHIFFACPLARQVWRNFLIWWELEDVAFNSYNEWLNWIVNIRVHKQLKIFLEDSFQVCKIGQRWGLVDGNWKGMRAWRIPPRGRALDDIASLTTHIRNFTLSDGDDKWIWKGDASGNFKVSNLALCIQNNLFADNYLGLHHIWNSWIPRKVNLCVWRDSINRLPTILNLIMRGVILNSTSCPFYNTMEESIDHCLITCSVVVPIWRKVWACRVLTLRFQFCVSPSLIFLLAKSVFQTSQFCPRFSRGCSNARCGLYGNGEIKW
uniref:RNA-directed DNA polymerase, eukaryota n=1 Tax=Tanacetum cinerariifolium TaxID=118510 RepID=A0A6L2N763_TANCI|nr:RNA-directed DNA polymerase, eukaryota [Tanacetum cinerariifolium]